MTPVPGASSLLTIDVGNTRTKFGLFADPGAALARSALPECARTLAVLHGDAFPWSELASWLSLPHLPTARAVVAGVKPAIVERLLEEWPDSLGWPRPSVIALAADLPLEVRLEFPDRVGIDRLLDAVAVNVIRPAATPAIVVDSGTATTVNLITSDGAFAGGAILPGLELSARSLHQHTAFLPLVPMDELRVPGVPVLGTDTPAAMRSGLLYGQVGAVAELIARLSRGLPTAPLVVITGGSGETLAAHLPIEARLERELTRQGLAVAGAASGSSP